MIENGPPMDRPSDQPAGSEMADDEFESTDLDEDGETDVIPEPIEEVKEVEEVVVTEPEPVIEVEPEAKPKARAKRTTRAKAAPKAKATPKRVPPKKSRAAKEEKGSPAEVAQPSDVVRTGSADKHLVSDEPVIPQPLTRPRSYSDLDAIPDDYD